MRPTKQTWFAVPIVAPFARAHVPLHADSCSSPDHCSRNLPRACCRRCGMAHRSCDAPYRPQPCEQRRGSRRERASAGGQRARATHSRSTAPWPRRLLLSKCATSKPLRADVRHCKPCRPYRTIGPDARMAVVSCPSKPALHHQFFEWVLPQKLAKRNKSPLRLTVLLEVARRQAKNSDAV